jgi:uncharacterized protein with GYD domain
MPAYVILGNYTHQGMEKIKAAPTRIDTAREVMYKLGAELKQWYLLMGKYDFLYIVDAPDDATITKIVLAIGSHGNLHTETTRAFTEEEFRQMVTDLPY